MTAAWILLPKDCCLETLQPKRSRQESITTMESAWRTAEQLVVMERAVIVLETCGVPQDKNEALQCRSDEHQADSSVVQQATLQPAPQSGNQQRTNITVTVDETCLGFHTGHGSGACNDAWPNDSCLCHPVQNLVADQSGSWLWFPYPRLPCFPCLRGDYPSEEMFPRSEICLRSILGLSCRGAGRSPAIPCLSHLVKSEKVFLPVQILVVTFPVNPRR